jgi:hypothetical protein
VILIEKARENSKGRRYRINIITPALKIPRTLMEVIAVYTASVREGLNAFYRKSNLFYSMRDSINRRRRGCQ